MNNITSTQFCADLPETMRQLSLHGNNISDMSNISRFAGLTLLGLGDNNVTDFSFIRELPELTAGSLRHAEGTQSFPAVETYYYGTGVNRLKRKMEGWYLRIRISDRTEGRFPLQARK